MKESIKESLGRDRTIDVNLITLEIVNALQRYRVEPFWFNSGRFQFVGVAGTSSYITDTTNIRTALVGPPNDVARINYVEARDPDDTNYRWPVMEETFDFVSQDLEGDPTGQPQFWCWHIDTRTSASVTLPSMLFSPEFDKAYQIHCSYVQDIGVPHAKWDGATWRFYDPTLTTNPVDDSLTNAWFVHGYELIEARALRNLYAKHTKNEARAAFYGQVEDEALRSMRAWSGGRKRPVSIQSWGV